MGDAAAVLLIHGLGGTQYDLGPLHRRLKLAGCSTHSITLPGHGTKPEDLLGVRAEDWLEAVRSTYRELLKIHQTVHVVGMCMGALLAIEVCKLERHTRGRLVALAPPVFIDGWSTPWYRAIRYLVYGIPGLPERIRVSEEEPYGVHNEQLRSIVRRKFERGDAFAYGWVPLACVREVDRLRRWVKTGLDRIECPALVIHARQDELTSLRSATFLTERIGGGRAAEQTRLVVLERSYHLICVDNDKEIVAQDVVGFCCTESGGAASNTSRGSVWSSHTLVSRRMTALRDDVTDGVGAVYIAKRVCDVRSGYRLADAGKPGRS